MGTAKFIQGNRACMEGAIKAGMRFFAGYPITPSTEIMEASAEMLPRVGGRFMQMEDEIASISAVIGGSLCGVKSMTATSGPGFSLMQEAVGYASFTETPCVIVNIMRGGPTTGLPTSPAQADVMQARWGTHGDSQAIVLVPASVQEMFTLTVRAFNLSERFRVPVILTTDEVIAHMRERIEIPDTVRIVSRKAPSGPSADYKPFQAGDDLVPAMAAFGQGYRFNVTGLTHDEAGFPTSRPELVQKLQSRLYDKIYKHLDEILDTEERNASDAEVMVLAYGSTARSAVQAVEEARSKGIRAGLIRPRTLWPFPDKVVEAAAGRCGRIIVAEMNMGQILHEVERCARGACEVVPCLQNNGEMIAPETILNRIRESAGK